MRIPKPAPKKTRVTVFTNPLTTFTKIGYPNPLGIRMIEITPIHEKVEYYRPRLLRKPIIKERHHFILKTTVTFKDDTTFYYERNYQVPSLEKAVELLEKDIYFMMNVYYGIADQRFGRKRP